MKKLVFPILLAMVLAGCNQAYLNPSEISITIDTIRASQVQITFKPDIEDAYYLLGMITKSDLKEMTIENMVQGALDFMSRSYDQMLEAGNMYASFEETYLYQGKLKKGFYYLESNTEYVIFAVQVNPVDRKIMGDIVSKECKTPYLEGSDMTFSIWTDNDTITISPSNNEDTYYFNYISLDEIEENYEGDATSYLYETINMLEEYGFMEYCMLNGYQKIILSEDKSMRNGEDYVFFLMGYNGEITTTIETAMFTYFDNRIQQFYITTYSENDNVTNHIVRR